MSDDLISRQALVEELIPLLNKNGDMYLSGKIIGMIDSEPTSYDVDKVVRELEEYQKVLCVGELKIFYGIIEKCIEIVRSGEPEKDGGLI